MLYVSLLCCMEVKCNVDVSDRVRDRTNGCRRDPTDGG